MSEQTANSNSRADFRVRCVPHWFDQLWDYPRNPTYRVLERMIAKNRLPLLTIYNGPPGSGKSVVARVCGAVSTCNNLDPVSRKPCGHCALCVDILSGTGFFGWPKSFFEIDCANRGSTSRPIDEIYDAWTHTSSYLPHHRERPYVVFLDEAQRLTDNDREALLKLVEKWCSSHIILATTDLTRLSIPGCSTHDNPLISRGTVFKFEYPNREEVVQGLLSTAARNDITLSEDAAGWIADRARLAPRSCLGELYTLSVLSNHITMRLIESEHPGWQPGSQSVDDYIDE